MNWCATPGEGGPLNLALTALCKQMDEAASHLASTGIPSTQRALIALSDFLVPPGYDTLTLLLLVGEPPPLFQKTIKPAGRRPEAASVRAFPVGLTVTIVPKNDSLPREAAVGPEQGCECPS